MGDLKRPTIVRPRTAVEAVTGDQPGQVLSALLGRAWNVAVFLRAAVGIARALGALHRRGMVHRDLSPSSILIDTATGEAWLTGLDISPRLVRDPAADLTRLVARNLPYMAPEQSGRIVRSRDSR